MNHMKDLNYCHQQMIYTQHCQIHSQYHLLSKKASLILTENNHKIFKNKQ